MGIKSNIIPAVLKTDPIKSILRNLDMKLPLGVFCGRTMRTIPPARMAKGETNQNMALQVVVSVKAAARKGPMMFPTPIQDPKIP